MIRLFHQRQGKSDNYEIKGGGQKMAVDGYIIINSNTSVLHPAQISPKFWSL